MGVRTDVPFRDLTDKEKHIVYDGPAVKKHILYHARNSNDVAELDFTYYSAVHTVENALAKVKDEKGMKRVEKYLREDRCPDCGGTRLSEAARAPRLRGIGLDGACAMTLSDLTAWVAGVPDTLPPEMGPMARNICEAFLGAAARLMDLGLGYLTLDRAASTLSTGERQRMQLARAVRNRTTGVLYVLDEPSIGLHPANLAGLTAVMDDLVADGNSVLLVDHDVQVLSHADHIVELGPGAGAAGGTVIARGSPAELARDPISRLGPFLRADAPAPVRPRCPWGEIFDLGTIRLSTGAIHTVKPLEADIPKGRLTVVTGVSGSGKTTLILESLVPALEAMIEQRPLPAHVNAVEDTRSRVNAVEAAGIGRVKLIDATPIGINVRSTVATYANIHDELRKIYARSPQARALGYKAGDFSYNTGSLRCPTCDGTGEISLDVQFLPDVDIPCPRCRGSRYGRDAHRVQAVTRSGAEFTLPELMAMDVHSALDACADWKLVRQRLEVLDALGLGYLTLGEAPQPSPAGRPSDSSWPVRWAGARRTRCSSLTSPPSACTPGRAHPAGRVPDAHRRRRHRGGHRARPGRDPRRRLCAGHGPRRGEAEAGLWPPARRSRWPPARRASPGNSWRNFLTPGGKTRILSPVDSGKKAFRPLRSGRFLPSGLIQGPGHV